MEMCLAPILILYYFPAEFSRHLYDNARRRRKFSHLPGQGRILPAFWRCGNAASLHYSPVSTFHHASKPSTPTPSLSLSLYPLSLEYTSSISRVDLVPPPPPPSIFFAAPPITETDDTVAPPLPAAPSIFASAFGYPDIFIDARSLAYSPPYLLVHQPRWIYEDRKSPLERTRKTSKDVNLRVARGRERERVFCLSEEFITIPLAMGSGHLPLSLLSTPRPSILFSINRDSLPRYHSNRFLVSVRPSVRPFQDL